MTLHVFTGPTLDVDTVRSMRPDAHVHPPVAHGDLLKLDVEPEDTVLIIDGYYHQSAPVRHKEILQLLSTGVRILGCSSLGALRAAELERYGMIGHGRIFHMYRDGEIDSDAEVAIAHLPGGDFRPLNVALVNIRIAAAAAAQAGALSDTESTAVIATAQSLHYTERSWPALEHASSTDPERAATWSRFSTFLEANPEARDAKRSDAIDTLEFIETVSGATGSTAEGWEARSWQNELIYSWLTRFPGRQVGETWVCDADVLRYHQLYSTDFPRLWALFVLADVASTNDAPIDVDDPSRKLAGAIRATRTSDLSAALVSRFLTSAETVDLDSGKMTWDEAVARTVIRTHTPGRGYEDLKQFAPELIDDDEARRAVAQAIETNDEVRSQAGARLVDRLSDSVLRRQLSRLWQVPARDTHELRIAAADRGFPSTAEAISSMRLFYLLDDGLALGRAAERWLRT